MEVKNVNKIDTNKVELEIEVDGKAFNDAINKVYKREVRNINIPGFRKGKAPRAVVEKMYGKGVFYEDAMNEILPDVVDEAVEKAELKVVPDKPELEVISVDENGFSFKVKLTTYPEVTVEGYKGIEIEAVSDEVTDEKIDKEIENARRRAGSTETVTDRAVEDGDTAVIDFEGFKDGEPFEGGKGEMYSLVIGSGSFIPGFEDQIIGHSTGDEFSVNVTFPEEYQVPELAGAPAEFKVKLHEIKARVLPELNDEFVQDVSADSNTVEEYRKEVAANLAEDLKKARENDISNKIADALADKVRGDIPKAMYDNRVTDMLKEMEMNLRRQGLDMQLYMQYTGMTEDILREQYAEQAEKQVNVRLALEKIAELENITPSEEDVEEEYKRLSELYKLDIEKVKKIVSSDDLTKDKACEKAMDLVRESAVIK